MTLNESKLDAVSLSRLWHWRLGHPASNVPIKMDDSISHVLNEDCYCCDQSKFKVGKFPKTDPLIHQNNPPFWRVFCDGYGGQNSLGAESYEGAIGGFVFSDTSSGTMKRKLYATTKQFPSILFQFLQDVESQHFVCREIVVDTHSVNISEEAEDVAALFHCKITPISAGTPQELAFAESAVRNLAKVSKSMMNGAPHLPKWAWGLADGYATYVHDILPQRSKGNKSPFEMRLKRKPELRKMFIKTFGAPLQYSPMDGPEHKRGKMTEWGWFAGLQGQMVVVIRKEDFKCINVSKKKIKVYEGSYAYFDPTTMKVPNGNPIEINDVLDVTDDEDLILDDEDNDHDEVGSSSQGESDESNLKSRMSNEPSHVQSIKSLSSHRRHEFINNPTSPNPPTQIIKSAQQYSSQEEGSHVPDHVELQKTKVLTELDELRRSAVKLAETASGKETILKALDKIMFEMSNKLPRKGALKKGKSKKKGVSKQNIVKGKRKRVTFADDNNLDDHDMVNEEANDVETSHTTSKAAKRQNRSSGSGQKGRKKSLKGAGGFKKGMRVSILTSRYDGNNPGSYSKGLDKRLCGTVVSIRKSGFVMVKWDISNTTTPAHFSHLDTLPTKLTTEMMVSIMMNLTEGAVLTRVPKDQQGAVPRNFFEALTRSDWRDWVASVKKEIEGWRDNAAASEVQFKDMKQGASVIPLGELFSRKRDGKYKFRQYAMGNLLRAGKDFGDTFATTVSGDGLRWFCSLACQCGKRIRGWDATTGYLQAKQRIPVYAYLPSHQHYSDLSYEKLSIFREELLQLIQDEGEAGLKKFAATQKRESRQNPKTVLSLDSAVYGLPDGGHSFAMEMQALMIKKCGMTQCEVDPSIYYKIGYDENGGVTDYLIAITWTDDVRYFGTDAYVKDHEATVSKNMKCTMEGDSNEFVSIDIKQDLDAGTLELSQENYWEKAVERFKEYMPANGPKRRGVPITSADMATLQEEVTDEEVKEAIHLPYSSLIGVIQYPSAFTAMEMRYSISVLSRYRAKWGVKHWNMAIKALEYGYATRKQGIIYTKSNDTDIANILTSYADSGFSVPRSQGCRLVMMNGAVISFTSKRHTTTDDSTTAAELTEQYLASCDVEGLRTLMAEVGLFQEKATIIYQDNMPAIQISMNRGALAKKTRAMDMRTLSVRNKIEDRKVVPIYIETTKMIADIGTKALDEKQFVLLRDIMNGYALQSSLKKGDEGVIMLMNIMTMITKQ